ncbi:hypothetical protein CK203_104065 [Vitis vinifera]|uniref:Uncharacterized protein n=1 Tax=Vitis vinifera TaxID=29760 RepID=A0A438F0I4_VITVI|nr:hypothetical protein CK203_104065 [Vitis vinifera]
MLHISFQDLKNWEAKTNLLDVWAKEVELYSANHECIKFLVGNKVDKVYKVIRVRLQQEVNFPVREEGPRKGGLVLIMRWARVVVCECLASFVNWAEVGWAMAKRLGHKGVVTIVPFANGKGLFFVETLEEAFSLHDSRFIKIKGGITVLLRRWSPKENSKVEGKFKEGWIDLRGLPFHLWSKVHLKKIMEQWGTVTKIDWKMLKLFDLISVAVAGKEDGRQGKEMGESIRQKSELHTWTDGRKRVEEARSIVGGGLLLGQLAERRRGELVKRLKLLLWGHGLLGQSRLEKHGLEGTKPSQLLSVDLSAKGKAKVDSEDSEVQLRGSALKCDSKKLWNALLPPSPGCRQGGRSRSEPLTIERSLSVSDALPMEDDSKAGTKLDQRFSASPRHSSGF